MYGPTFIVCLEGPSLCLLWFYLYDPSLVFMYFLRAVVLEYIPGFELCCFVHGPNLLTVCNVLMFYLCSHFVSGCFMYGTGQLTVCNVLILFVFSVVMLYVWS